MPCDNLLKFFSVHFRPPPRLHHIFAIPLSNLIRQLAQLFADALGLFLDTTRDGILKQGVKSFDRLYRVICGIAIVSTPSMGSVPLASTWEDSVSM